MNCKFKEEKISLPILNMGIAQRELYLSSFYINCSVYFQIPPLVFSLVFLGKKIILSGSFFPSTNKLTGEFQQKLESRVEARKVFRSCVKKFAKNLTGKVEILPS